VASQKFTSPGLTATPLDCTVAVRVMAVPDEIVVTGLPPAVTANVVVVAEGLVCASRVEKARLMPTSRAAFRKERTLISLQGQDKDRSNGSCVGLYAD
jgi:hypothetical protein